ncbi:hypothetical protein Pmani_037905 [Petrolisthes manimaculis]|uniref:Uncharacterized protein n=1 Tax=Petrolisthes manimaculis TaxID=1843537 RepID=A0AAE1NI44_9EUCA|nr:hypothetical protein Pmani_037905 [Petrolisthes manimaculis]
MVRQFGSEGRNNLRTDYHQGILNLDNGSGSNRDTHTSRIPLTIIVADASGGGVGRGIILGASTLASTTQHRRGLFEGDQLKEEECEWTWMNE